MDDTYVYTGNLPFDVTADMIKEAFSPFGTVEDVKLAYAPGNGPFRGFGFTKMKTKEDAENVIKNVSDKNIGSRACYLEPGTLDQDLWDSSDLV